MDALQNWPSRCHPPPPATPTIIRFLFIIVATTSVLLGGESIFALDTNGDMTSAIESGMILGAAYKADVPLAPSQVETPSVIVTSPHWNTSGASVLIDPTATVSSSTLGVLSLSALFHRLWLVSDDGTDAEDKQTKHATYSLQQLPSSPVDADIETSVVLQSLKVQSKELVHTIDDTLSPSGLRREDVATRLHSAIRSSRVVSPTDGVQSSASGIEDTTTATPGMRVVTPVFQTIRSGSTDSEPFVSSTAAFDSDNSSSHSSNDDCRLRRTDANPENIPSEKMDIVSPQPAVIQNTTLSDEVAATAPPPLMTQSPNLPIDLHSPSSESQIQSENSRLAAGTIAGIIVASILFAAIVTAALGFTLFRRLQEGLRNKYDSSKLSSDNCSYLDNLQVSYINSHIDIPKECSDEMFSLDNDSFLNSLEAMTMENYWAEESRNSKV